MRNKWKIAFWTLLFVFILTTVFLTRSITNQVGRINHMQEVHEGTEYDLERITSVVKGKLSKSDFSEILKSYPDSAELKELGLSQIRITFDINNRVDSITTKWNY